MINPDTAMHAIRILGIDIANLTTQVSVFKASFEEMAELADIVDERSWQQVMSDDDEPMQTVTGVLLPPDQQLAFQRILMLINGLR
jgi:hypothetical protein